MAIKRSMLLWRKATPLEEAWLVHASQEERDAYVRLPDWYNPPLDTEGLAQAKLFERLLSGVSAMKRAHSEKTDSEDRLKAALIQTIRLGEFELLGFRVSPDRSRNAVIIPAERLGKFEPNWKDASLDLSHESYIDLRVSPISARPTGRRRGRPGSNEIILEIIKALHAEPNSDFCKVPRKEAVERVREKLREVGYSVGQLGDGTTKQNISKLILNVCPPRKIKLDN